MSMMVLETSLAVTSIFAITTSLLSSFTCAPSSSQVGAVNLNLNLNLDLDLDLWLYMDCNAY